MGRQVSCLLVWIGRTYVLIVSCYLRHFHRQATSRKSKRIEQKAACEIVQISDDEETESLASKRFTKSVTKELERINDNEGKDS